MKTFLKEHKQCLDYIRTQELGEAFTLTAEQFSCNYERKNSWEFGPFVKKDKLTFKKKWQMKDPHNVGWESTFIFNPCLLEHEGRLHLFYRANPKKESLCSRIGHAAFDEKTGWTDFSGEPAIYPEILNEAYGTEDPKIYKANGKFYMFYQADWKPDDFFLNLLNEKSDYKIVLSSVTKYAISEDLMTWKKMGTVIPFNVSRGWSKGAVIAKNGRGEAVKIDGKYLMFISEGCGGKQHIGYSTDMENWIFEERTFLTLPANEATKLYEVACCTVDEDRNSGKFVLDFLYADRFERFKAGQALYSMNNPFFPLEMSFGHASLAWGGLIKYLNKWTFAQGWSAPLGSHELYVYQEENQ